MVTQVNDYGVLEAKEGISLRGLFILDDKGTPHQITVNDLPVGRPVQETKTSSGCPVTDKRGKCARLAGSPAVTPSNLKSRRAKNISRTEGVWP